MASPVRPEIWKKLILNAATLPPAALTGMHAGALTASEDAHALVTDTAREAVAVARALGYDIDADERVTAIHALLEKAGPSKASMLQDFEAGRRTEVDVINGAVVRAADETGVEVPLNRSLLRLVKAWESPRGLVSTRLTYFGAAGYEIVGPAHRILIDPFLAENPLAPCTPRRARRHRT